MLRHQVNYSTRLLWILWRHITLSAAATSPSHCLPPTQKPWVSVAYSWLFYLLNYIICMFVFGLFQSVYYSETYIYCLFISNWFLFVFVWRSTVQFSSAAQSCPTLCNPTDFSMPGFPVHYQLPELAHTHVHWVIYAIKPSHPLLPPFPPVLNLSQHQVFSSESVLHIRRPEYWSFIFSISPYNEYSGLISFRMDWLDLLAVQGTLKSLLQLHSSKASILWCSAFFVVQLSL